MSGELSAIKGAGEAVTKGCTKPGCFPYCDCDNADSPPTHPPVVAEALAIPDECPHMIVFDDAEREPIMFAGTGAREAALKTWDKISGSWNAHLFVRIERNSRDDRYPSAIAAPPASGAVHLRALLERVAKEADYMLGFTNASNYDECRTAVDELRALLAKGVES